MKPFIVTVASLSALAIASLAVPSAAQDFPTTMPALSAPKAFSLPGSETYRLSNGMQVTLIPFGTVPKAQISVQLYAGQLNEGREIWLSNITARMLREGTTNRSPDQIAAEAASMGSDLGVGVSSQATAANMNVLSERAPDAVALLGDLLRNPVFPDNQLSRIKADFQRNRVQTLSNPQGLAQIALLRAYYGDHRYGQVIPTQAQLDGYSVADLKRFYGANYGSRRAHIYVAGQFDVAAVKAAIEKSFGSWTAGPERLSLPPKPQAGPRVIFVDRPGAPQSTLSLAFPTDVAGSADDIPMRVANSLLGGSFNSRITTNIREDKGYTYSPGSGITFTPGDARWTFNADVTTASTGAALKEVFYEIRRMADTPPSAAEVEGARTYMSGLFVLQNSTPGALIGSLATRRSLGLPDDWLDRYVPAVQAVTAQQMSAAIKADLPLDKAILVVLGDLKTVEPQVRALPELKGATFQTVTVP